MRMVRHHEDAVAGDHCAGLTRGPHRDQPLRSRLLVMPDLPAAPRIQRPTFVDAGDVHDAAGYHRCRLRG